MLIHNQLFVIISLIEPKPSLFFQLVKFNIRVLLIRHSSVTSLTIVLNYSFLTRVRQLIIFPSTISYCIIPNATSTFFISCMYSSPSKLYTTYSRICVTKSSYGKHIHFIFHPNMYWITTVSQIVSILLASNHIMATSHLFR